MSDKIKITKQQQAEIEMKINHLIALMGAASCLEEGGDKTPRMNKALDEINDMIDESGQSFVDMFEVE
ncbi:membrane lipoprotein [Vibrio phage 1.007.O._10N.261.55.F9]|nr:membrane lipoprotein [Vibrio phage 1.007.O._10N.261.55.F9]